MTLAPEPNDLTPFKCKGASWSRVGSIKRPHLREVWFWGWVLPQFWVRILIVDVVAHSDELLSMVGAGDEDHCHTDGIALRDEGWVGGIGLVETHPRP